ncbi:MAG: hypothetical protein K8F91_22150, partial [Candidatus Obscuribacterales bacterium]|nr:hypothetical protein [Candidatus Obscuribacterales bacterium]
MIYRKVTGFALLGLVLSFLATGKAEAKWYLFGKGESGDKSQIAATVPKPESKAEKTPRPDLEFSQNRVVGGKTAQTTGTVTRQVEKRVEKKVATQNRNNNDGSDLIESTLTMPINML